MQLNEQAAHRSGWRNPRRIGPVVDDAVHPGTSNATLCGWIAIGQPPPAALPLFLIIVPRGSVRQGALHRTLIRAG